MYGIIRNGLIIIRGHYAVIGLLIISIILILVWGVVDKKSLKRLSSSIRFGMFTYLLTLVFLSPLSYTGSDVEINMLCAIGGSIFAAITVLMIMKAAINLLKKLNFSKSMFTFLSSVLTMIILMGLEVAFSKLAILNPTQDYIIMVIFSAASIALIVAIIAILVIVLRLLFGKADEDPVQKNEVEN